MLTTVRTGITFCVSAKPDILAGDLKVLDTTELVSNERTVAILIDKRTPRAVPGPQGGLPFIGGYSEIYPDFLGSYQSKFSVTNPSVTAFNTMAIKGYWTSTDTWSMFTTCEISSIDVADNELTVN